MYIGWPLATDKLALLHRPFPIILQTWRINLIHYILGKHVPFEGYPKCLAKNRMNEFDVFR